IVGEPNRLRAESAVAEVKAGLWAGPLAFVGRHGAGKTSCARMIARCLCCPAFQASGEPCGTCEGCRSQSPEYNGDRHGYRHWEIDCARTSRRRLANFFSEVSEERRAVVFLDEVPNLRDPASQKALLKFAEEFRGVLLAAVTV